MVHGHDGEARRLEMCAKKEVAELRQHDSVDTAQGRSRYVKMRDLHIGGLFYVAVVDAHVMTDRCRRSIFRTGDEAIVMNG